MPKQPKDRKVPSCVLCGQYNATRRTSHPDVGTYPLCRQCHEGGLEHTGSPEALFKDIHRVASGNNALTLEKRKYVGDAHITKDGTDNIAEERAFHARSNAILKASMAGRNAEMRAGRGDAR